MDSSNPSPTAFPSLEASFRFHPHFPTNSDDSALPMMTPIFEPIPEIPLSATTMIEYPHMHHTDTTETPMPWMTSFIPHPHFSHHPHTVTVTSVVTSVIDATATANGTGIPVAPVTVSVSDGKGGLSHGAKIGLGVGITISALLAFLAVGLALLSCRRRKQTRNENRRSTDSELNIWKEGLRNGRAGTRESVNQAGRLWEGYKGSEKGVVGVVDKGVDKKEVYSHRGEKGRESLPPYLPKDRTSAASLGLPIMNAPAVQARNFLDIEEKR